METTIMGYIETTMIINSFIPGLTKGQVEASGLRRAYG